MVLVIRFACYGFLVKLIQVKVLYQIAWNTLDYKEDFIFRCVISRESSNTTVISYSFLYWDKLDVLAYDL